jgi:hypothetical protein
VLPRNRLFGYPGLINREILDGERSTRETPSLRKMHLKMFLKANGTLCRPFVFLNR